MLNQPASPKPSTGLANPYREGVAMGRLRYMSCQDCNAPQTLVRYACQQCGGTRLDWFDSALVGKVYALTVVTRAPSDAFRALVPYTLVLVDLREGPRLMGHGEPGLVIGDAVVASFIDFGEKRLVFFRPSASVPEA